MKKAIGMALVVGLVSLQSGAKEKAKAKDKDLRGPSSIGNCAAKVKDFAERFGSQYLDISPSGERTSIDFASDGRSVKVSMVDSTGQRIREVQIKMGAGKCRIVGVETLDFELY